MATAHAYPRLAEIAERDAVAAPLALLHLATAPEKGWEAAVPALDPALLVAGQPLLQRQTLSVSRHRACALLESLARVARRAGSTEAAAVGGALGEGALDPLALLEASICQDTERLAGLAGEAGLALDALAVLGQVFTLPLMRACGQAAAPLLEGSAWDAGYCPVCAAWPALAERRGLDGRRYLRCGRCAASWTYYLQRCPYCGNRDHKTLGYLAPEAQREARQASICDTCHGYLKSVTTVSALASDEITAHDLSTLELDVAAMEHGYGRPDERGFPLEVRVIDAGR